MAVPRESTSRAKRITTKSGTTGRTAKKAAVEPQQRSVIMQARVEGSFARTLVERDARLLGLGGASDLVREGLRLVHQRAQEQAMADSYDAFYGGSPSPLPIGVDPADG